MADAPFERTVIAQECIVTLNISNGDQINVACTMGRVTIRYIRAASHEEAALFMAAPVARGLGETLLKITEGQGDA